MISDSFELPCEICAANNWTIIYTGPVRDGSHGNYVNESKIARCNNCNIERLEESKCLSGEDYESENYRNHLGQSPEIIDYQHSHDDLQKDFLSCISSSEVRNKTVCDIGCAGGSLLDHVSNIAGEVIAIEPATFFHEYLRSKKYKVFSSVNDAALEYNNKVDVIFLIQVIEHVLEPVSFLKEIKSLLKDTGKLILSTPNRNEVLMNVCPEEFEKFFYRRAHRWYFEEKSLQFCLDKAGFKKQELIFNHRQSLSNALNWLKTNSPQGNNRVDIVTESMELVWKSELERTGTSDTLISVVGN